MTWNGRKLMSYNKSGKSISYKYDGNGLRTQKVINGVNHYYYYENNQLLYEIKQGVYELYYKYDADGNLYSITRYRYSDGEKHVYYAVTNTRGDVIELRAASGGIYAKYTYDSWGKCIAVTNSSGAACSVNTVSVQNSIRYRGYVYDHETGLYYLQSRYYDPETGRFLNADDVKYIGYSGENISYNAFAYCENNAVNNEDKNGFIVQTITNWLNRILFRIKNVFPFKKASSFYSSEFEYINSAVVTDFCKALGLLTCADVEINADNFVKKWNSCESDFVVLNAHGRPSSIGYEGTKQIIFSVKNEKKLKKNENIKCLIIFSCKSNAKTDGKTKNLATVLSKKISSTGVVVASKHDVASFDKKTVANMQDGDELIFKSSYKSSSGWTVLRNGTTIKASEIPIEVTISRLINFLVDNRFI